MAILANQGYGRDELASDGFQDFFLADEKLRSLLQHCYRGLCLYYSGVGLQT